MPTAEARVETERASRYLDQLCRHAQQMGSHPHYRQGTHGGGGTHRPPEVRHVEWSGTRGTVDLSLGKWMLEATPGALLIRVEAADEQDLQRMRDLIAARIEKIGRRDRLGVVWGRPRASGVLPSGRDRVDAPHHEEHDNTRGMPHRRAVGAVVPLLVLVAAAHVVLGGSVLAASRWLGWGAGAIVVAVVVVKAVGMGGLVAHRRRRRAPR